MSVRPPHRPSFPGALGGALRAWLARWSIEIPPSSAGAGNTVDAPVAHHHGAVRVLVVDDSPVNLLVISALMASRGIVPVLAADGAEAVALASELPFDLILMDLQMPVLDGLAATSAIRRCESDLAKPAVPVVAYSGMCPAWPLLARHGMNGSLRKPCDDQDLEDCLLQWCPGYRAGPASRSSPASARLTR